MVKKAMNLAAFIDFDGTVTDIDVVDGLLVQFAKDGKWIAAEKEWLAGKIASDECLKRQLGSVRLSRAELQDYLSSIPLDPGFFALRERLASENIPLTVLSDGFDLFIRRIFKLNGIESQAFRANRLVHKADRLVPSFPYKASSCGRCAHCKAGFLKRARGGADRHFIFIGDGLSDACAVREADTVFAKAKLAQFCEEQKIRHLPYRNLTEVLARLDERFGDLRSVAWRA